MLARIRKSQEERDGGFTLIELLVVMIIIGILAAIAIPTFLSQKSKAHESAAKSDASSIAQDIAAAQVDGSITALTITAAASQTAGGTWTVSYKDPNGVTQTMAERVTADDTPSVTLTGDAYCVTVTPADTNASAWSAGNNGLAKGTTCP